MQIHEILDRLEILNPDNKFFSDLRKVILNEDYYALFRLLQGESDSQLVEGLRKLVRDDRFDTDCFSRGQLESKKWVVEQLKLLDVDLGTVFLCAGWYATLATMIFESGIKVDKIRSFDIDPSCAEIAETFNKPQLIDGWKFKASTADIHQMTDPFTYSTLKSDGSSILQTDSPITIINTSCEHIHNFTDWYNKLSIGKILVLQTNNYYEIEEHVNCSETLEDFAAQTPMSLVLYEGELELPKYKRFMRIGYK